MGDRCHVRGGRVNLLLDTHILIWLATEPKRVPESIRSTVLNAETRYVSAVSAAEVAIKSKTFGDKFPFTLEHFHRAMADLDCEELPLLIRHNAAYMRIPREQHKNPHDQLIMAQAMTEQVILVTSDKHVRASDVSDLQVLC